LKTLDNPTTFPGSHQETGRGETLGTMLFKNAIKEHKTQKGIILTRFIPHRITKNINRTAAKRHCKWWATFGKRFSSLLLPLILHQVLVYLHHPHQLPAIKEKSGLRYDARTTHLQPTSIKSLPLVLPPWLHHQPSR